MDAESTPSQADAIASCFVLEQSPCLSPEVLARLTASLESRNLAVSDTEGRALQESWRVAPELGESGPLACHFMQNFAPISQRIAKGLAFTAISSLRLEHPLRQQEDFNRACLMFAQSALSELQGNQARIAALETRLARIPELEARLARVSDLEARLARLEGLLEQQSLGEERRHS